MGSTLLEQTRALHEENERLERLVARDLQQEVKTHRDRLYQSHRVRTACDQVLSNSHRLVSHKSQGRSHSARLSGTCSRRHGRCREG